MSEQAGLYTVIPESDDLQALDIDRRMAERDCTDAAHWLELAARYDALGQVCRAEACRRRAEHYQEVSSEPV